MGGEGRFFSLSRRGCCDAATGAGGACPAPGAECAASFCGDSGEAAAVPAGAAGRVAVGPRLPLFREATMGGGGGGPTRARVSMARPGGVHPRFCASLGSESRGGGTTRLAWSRGGCDAGSKVKSAVGGGNGSQPVATSMGARPVTRDTAYGSPRPCPAHPPSASSNTPTAPIHRFVVFMRFIPRVGDATEARSRCFGQNDTDEPMDQQRTAGGLITLAAVE
jgi:hypothetical protein